MVPESFHDFFLAAAGAAAALIGLLFVAISVAPERISGPRASMVEQTRAASALSCFLVPLALALVALLPGAHLGVPAVILSAAGLLFVAATVRRYLSMPRERRESLRGLMGLIGFTAALGVVLAYGIVALVAPDDSGPVAAIAGATIALVLLGVERAWALIGGRDTGRFATLNDLIRGEGGTGGAERSED
jgi:hypothetical protein